MLLRFLALTTLLSLITYWLTIHTTPKDTLRYNQLSQESLTLRTRKALEEKPAHQERSHVQKDIWTEGEMHHFQIKSEESSLTIGQTGDKIEATELLKHIHCTVENAFTLTADEGFYTYPSNQFIAEKNCHLVQNDNFIDGTKIHLDLTKEIVTYYNPKGHLAEGLIDFTAKTLLWDKRKEKLYLNNKIIVEQSNKFIIHANQGVVNLRALEPKLITLKGDVKLISSTIQDKESFAIADSLTYNPITKTLLFSAKKRVLFWQEGLSLSAPKVLIKEDQTVVGLGDVHFTFDLDEQDFIDNIFNKYL